MRLTYISRNYKTTLQGGAKGRIDVEDILTEEGAVNLGLRRTFSHNKVYDYLRNLTGILHYMLSVRRRDVVVVQYPFKKYYRLVTRWARLRGARSITLVHDLGSFRRHRLSIAEEIRKLSLTDVAVVANDNTAAWLHRHGYAGPMVIQEAWDYLSDATPNPREKESASATGISFIGHLRPSQNGYLYKMPSDIHLHLYGGGAPDNLPDNLEAHGMKNPDELIRDCRGRFGLIWYDGELYHTPDGYIGDYIRYCNPHKLSLYMRCGKPVILWRGAGAASLVEREGIGLTVDSLTDLAATLSAVTDAEYAQMLVNVRRISDDVAHGTYTRRWLRAALNRLK